LDNQSITFISPFAYPLVSVNYTAGCGGAERQFFLFGRELTKIGWRVSFITDIPHNTITSSSTIFPIYYANFSYLGGLKIHVLPNWLSLWRVMAKTDTEYYVIKYPGHLLALMSLFCKIHNRRLVFWAQLTSDAHSQESISIKKKVAKSIQNWGLTRSDIVIAQSDDQRKKFKNNYNIKAHVVPNICDNLICNSSMYVNFYMNEKKVDILWVGNSMSKKRQEIFFELAKLLPQRTFAIAMNNNDTQRFEQAKENAKKLPNVTFLGTVPPFEMELWFQRTKLFLNTSKLEGFPNTFLQAWMNRVPVISLNIDPDNVIKSNRIGCVIANSRIMSISDDNFEKLAYNIVEPVEKLLENDALRDKMGESAAEYVRKNHAPKVVVSKLVEILQKKTISLLEK